jgi:hypothetical protein
LMDGILVGSRIDGISLVRPIILSLSKDETPLHGSSG